MMKKIRKPVSILLVFMMIVSLFTVVPISAGATDYTEDYVYLEDLVAGDTLSATDNGDLLLNCQEYSVIIKGGTYRERRGFEPQADDIQFQEEQARYMFIMRDHYGPLLNVATQDDNLEYYPLDAEGNVSDKWYVLSNENNTVTLAGYVPAPAPTEAPAPETFKVYVKKLTGGTFTIENLTGETTVAQLKEIIADQIGIPVTAQQMLVFAGKQIEDAKTLADYNIGEESTIHLVIRSYTVTWLNYDNSELGTKTVQYGATPSYDGEAPTKPEDANNTYTFAAWDDGTTTYMIGVDDLPPVTGNVTYTAVFTADPKPTETPTEAPTEPEPAVGTIYDSGEHVASELNTGDYFVSGIESLFDDNFEYTITLKAGTYTDWPDGETAYDADFTAENGMFTVGTENGILYFDDRMEGYSFVPFVDDAIGNAFYVESADHDAKTITLSGANVSAAPTEPETEAPTEPAFEPGYYVVGTFTDNDTDWTIDPAYQLSENPDADGEYMFTGLELTATDQFKVVYTSDGQTVETWYPDGSGRR